MRLSHYLLIIATIGWMALALVWGMHTFVMDITFAPLELVYLAAFAVSAVIGGIIFDEVGKWATRAEFSGVSLPSPSVMLQNMRYSRQKRQSKARSKKETKKTQSELRRW